MSMKGFARVLEKDEAASALRAKLLKDGSLIAWPGPTMVGVTKNKEAQRINTPLLKLVADFWCPQWTAPAMIPIDDIKAEVFGAKLQT